MPTVTLRTRPIEDPGEWCQNRDTRRRCDRWDTYACACKLGHLPSKVVGGAYRPQSCIDSAEEEKP